MFKLDPRIQQLTPYDPIVFDDRIRLDANESFLEIPKHLWEKITAQIQTLPLNRYPDPYASNLCQAFANYYQVDVNQVVAGNGSDELIGLLIDTFFNQDQKILLMEHDFSMYRFYTEMFNKKYQLFKKDEDLNLSIDDLITTINQQDIQGVLLSNPCNPTSLCLKQESILKLVANVSALVIIDEAYMDFSDQSVLNQVDQYSNLIVLKTSSKSVGLAALRLGFAVSNPSLIQTLKAVKSPYNVNSISQLIGTLLFEEQDYLMKCNELLIASRKQLQQDLEIINKNQELFEMIYPSSTNFIYLKTRKDQQIYDFLLEQGIVIRKMTGYLRISAGSVKENEQLINALTKFIKKGNHNNENSND